MSPLELMRKYTIEKKTIDIRDGYVYFGSIAFPKETRTNFKIFRKQELEGAPKEYYTLESIHYFMKHLDLEHPAYVRAALADSCKGIL